MLRSESVDSQPAYVYADGRQRRRLSPHESPCETVSRYFAVPSMKHLDTHDFASVMVEIVIAK